MSDNSAIEWTDASWNPIRARNLKNGKLGWHCEHATIGCEFCYAEGFNRRLGTGLPFKPGHRKDIEIFLDEKTLLAPLRWKRPRKIFVCSMTDLFADFVKDVWLDRIFAVMALCPQHTFQVLTKRAERMRDYLSDSETEERVWRAQFIVVPAPGHSSFDWPLPNVWLGVSAERQQEADERVPLLLQTPAAVRFVSCEPLLGPIDLQHIDIDADYECFPLTAWEYRDECDRPQRQPKLDWVIVGGESGREARPMHPQWARDLRDQCAAAGVAFFFKQYGGWHPLSEDEEWGRDWFLIDRNGDADLPDERVPLYEEGEYAALRVGTKAAGRLLDGREHNEFPQGAGA
jgi:protein gp37